MDGLVTGSFNEISITYRVYSFKARLALATAFLTIGFASIFLCGTISYLFLTRRKLRTIPNLINLSLLASDAIFIAAIIPMSAIELFVPHMGYNSIFVAARMYLIGTYYIANADSISLIAFVTALQLRKMRMPHTLMPKRVLILATIISLIISITMPTIMCIIIKYYDRKGFGMYMLTNLIFIFLIISISYCSVLYEMRKSRKRLRPFSNLPSRKQSHYKVARTIDRILLAFSVTHLLVFVRGSLFVYGAYFDEEFEIKYLRELAHLDTAATLAAACGIIINPLIYFYTQPLLKKEISSMALMKNIMRFTTSVSETGEIPQVGTNSKTVTSETICNALETVNNAFNISKHVR